MDGKRIVIQHYLKAVNHQVDNRQPLVLTSVTLFRRSFDNSLAIQDHITSSGGHVAHESSDLRLSTPAKSGNRTCAGATSMSSSVV